ncbi:unnamed protein product [Linum tenue]|uniref:DJ-1/PfpI domain-containing protein n=1 Tax=Linum tenue TaxID=586396 RepID=A0AAV0MM69_9ROSI|nr:unnamed protein product [Linum tenue]
MESFFCTLCPAKLPSLKFYYSMAVTPPSSLTCASVMESPSRRKSAAPRNRSSKPISQTASPQIPTTPTTSNSDSTAPISAAPPKKVLVPIGFGTEEMEAVILIDVLRRAGAKVTVASVEPQLEIEAAAGSKLVADISISDCSDETFDLVALPGGMPGSARLRDCEVLRRITSKQADEERLYGAICAAPAVTLLPWGLLRKKQVVYFGYGIVSNIWMQDELCLYLYVSIANCSVACNARSHATQHSWTSSPPSGLLNQIFKFQEKLLRAAGLEHLFSLLYPLWISCLGRQLPRKLQRC